MLAAAQQAYQAVQVQSSDPKRLLLMLYEALGRDLAQAAEAMAAREYERKHDCLVRAQDILRHLAAVLRDDPSPDLADGLRTLYTHLDLVITQANVHDDAAKLEHVRGIVAQLDEAWRRAAEQCN